MHRLNLIVFSVTNDHFCSTAVSWDLGLDLLALNTEDFGVFAWIHAKWNNAEAISTNCKEKADAPGNGYTSDFFPGDITCISLAKLTRRSTAIVVISNSNNGGALLLRRRRHISRLHHRLHHGLLVSWLHHWLSIGWLHHWLTVHFGRMIVLLIIFIYFDLLIKSLNQKFHILFCSNSFRVNIIVLMKS